MSTTTRMLLGFLALLVAGAVGLLPVLLERVSRQYLEAAEEPMVDTAHIVASIIGQHVDASGTLDLATIRTAMADARSRKFDVRIYNLMKKSISTHLYVTDRRGVVLFDSDNGKAEGQDFSGRRDVGFTLAGQYGARSTRADPDDPRTSTMFVAAPILRADEIIGVASVSKPTSAIYGFVDETRAWIRGLLIVFLGLVTIGAVLVANLFAGPIRRLTNYAQAITRGERVSPPRGGSPEVVMLARAFEDMRDALEDRKYVETYVQTLTHEMKSPVAGIRGAVELLREEIPAGQREKFLGNIHAESRRLQAIIDRLLALSAIEVRKSLEEPRPVSLSDLATGVCEQMRSAAESHGVTLQTSAADDAPPITGEPFLLEIALTNLIQNAIDFSPRGGAIHVAVESLEDRRGVTLTVEDEGPGIPDYALPRVFERFYSLQHPATGRKSSGLGLCFVLEAVELHGGTVTVGNRTDRSGVRATMRFPAKRRAETRGGRK